jgi:hypothetical protein
MALFLFLNPSLAFAKEKQRQWQMGTVLDTNGYRSYAGSIENGSAAGTYSGNTAYAHASGSSIPVYRVFETYAIQAGHYIYVCSERIKRGRSKPALLTVTGSVQFAVDKEVLSWLSAASSKVSIQEACRQDRS